MSKFFVGATAFACPAFLAMLLAGCTSKVPADLPLGTVLHYTDVCYHEMTGDVIGLRLTLTKSPGGYAARLQLISGEPPGSTTDGTATVNGSALVVALAGDREPLFFKGTITEKEVTALYVYTDGRTSGGGDFHLKRVGANEMSLGACP